MIEVRCGDPLGVLGSDLLADHAAHRDANEVGALDLEVLDQPDGVGGHVVEPVDGGAGQPEHPGGDVDPAADLRGEADIAVVEADHVVAAHREQLAELVVPAEHLHAQAHDEQDRFGLRIAEVVVTELDALDDRRAGSPRRQSGRPRRSRRQASSGARPSSLLDLRCCAGSATSRSPRSSTSSSPPSRSAPSCSSC